MKNSILSLVCFLGFAGTVYAQEPYIRLGQKALMDRQFTLAADYFEKACDENSSDMNALWFLGYSYFHANEYRKCITTFDKLVTLKPSETVAYYYRGKAKTVLYSGLSNLLASEKERLIKGAIRDFSTGIEMSPNDFKFYQNRGLAYYDLGVYKNQKISNIYNKTEAIAAVNLSLKDFQKVMAYSGSRSDIQSLIDKARRFLIDAQK